MTRKVLRTAIRCDSLTLTGQGPKSLRAQERHGKRADGTSKLRRKRDNDPMVWGTLDLQEAYKKHVAGARMSKGLKRPVLHHIIQFPELMSGPLKPKTAEKFLAVAVKFINLTYGDREDQETAVFAARWDLDERSQWVCDVFSAPRYVKRTKAKPEGEVWVSTTRHCRALCKKYETEIRRRHKGKFLDGPRQQGIALNAEWWHLLKTTFPDLAPRRWKPQGKQDRLEPEAFKREKGRLRAEQRWIDYQQDVMDEAMTAVLEGTHIPQTDPCHWRFGPKYDRETCPQDRMRKLLSPLFRNRYRAFWDRVLVPAAQTLWGGLTPAPDRELEDTGPSL